MSGKETAPINELEREVWELKRADKVLRLASMYFAQAELDRHNESPTTSSKCTGTVSGLSRSTRYCPLTYRRKVTCQRHPAHPLRRATR